MFLTYAPSGNILYQQSVFSEGIWAIPFSLDDLSTAGARFLVTQHGGSPDVSRDGRLIYRIWPEDGAQQLIRVDRSGIIERKIKGLQGVSNIPVLSPDGGRVAITRIEPENSDIWIYEMEQETWTRLTYDTGVDTGPVAWSSAGDQLVFVSFRSGIMDLYIRATDGSGGAQPLVTGPFADFAPNWSRDGPCE